MANADTIRKALMALMRAKGYNVEAQRAAAPIRRSGFSDEAGEIPVQETILDEAAGTAQRLGSARRDLQAVQGTDPLATPIQETVPKNLPPIPKELKMRRAENVADKADLKRTSPKDPSRLPSDEAGMRQAENLAEDAMWGGVDPDATMANLIANDIRRKGLDNLDPADLLELDAFAGKGASRALIKEMFADQQVNNPLTTADDIPF